MSSLGIFLFICLALYFRSFFRFVFQGLVLLVSFRSSIPCNDNVRNYVGSIEDLVCVLLIDDDKTLLNCEPSTIRRAAPLGIRGCEFSLWPSFRTSNRMPCRAESLNFKICLPFRFSFTVLHVLLFFNVFVFFSLCFCSFVLGNILFVFVLFFFLFCMFLRICLSCHFHFLCLAPVRVLAPFLRTPKRFNLQIQHFLVLPRCLFSLIFLHICVFVMGYVHLFDVLYFCLCFPFVFHFHFLF